MEQSSVSVVVVSYNTLDKLRRCLDCIERHHEVIVVDNASGDGTVETISREYPHVRLLPNEENRGFGAANNQGSQAATRDLVLFLNSDAYASPGAIDLLSKAFADKLIAGAGGRLLNVDGSLQQSSANSLTLWAVFCEQSFLERLFPSSALLSPYWNSHKLQEVAQVEQVMGACLMVRRGATFDERFFLYCEDTELCRRLRAEGQILYVPRARFTHELGSSSLDSRWLAVARYNRGKELYFSIHHGSLSMLACWLLNRFGALLRFAVWSLVAILTFGQYKRSLAGSSTFLKVLFAPAKDPSPMR